MSPNGLEILESMSRIPGSFQANTRIKERVHDIGECTLV